MLRRMFTPKEIYNANNNIKPPKQVLIYKEVNSFRKECKVTKHNNANENAVSHNTSIINKTNDNNTLQMSKSSKQLHTISKKQNTSEKQTTSNTPNKQVTKVNHFPESTNNNNNVNIISSTTNTQNQNNEQQQNINNKYNSNNNDQPVILQRSKSTQRLQSATKTPQHSTRKCNLTPCPSRSYKKTSNQSTNKSVDQLEEWITYIKEHGFENNSKLMANKQNKVTALDEHVKDYHIKVNKLKRNDSRQNIKAYKTINDNYLIKDTYDKAIKHKNEYAYELKELKREVEQLPIMIENMKNDTLNVNKLYIDECSDVNARKDSIQKLNKMISGIQKEKEMVAISLNVVNKNITALKGRISDVVKCSCQFMDDVRSLVNNKELFDNN